MPSLAGWRGVLVSGESSRLRLFFSTCWELLRLFAVEGRYFLIPLVVLLLLTATLLVLTEMVPALAPFVYAIF